MRRQVESLDWLRVPLRFWILAAAPSRRAVTLRSEWPRLRDALDAGQPVPLGLVRRTGVNPFRLTRNHQVLAYGYELDGERLVVRIYDPNWPDDDSVALVVDGVVDPASATLTQSTGEAIAAFFVAPWSARPVGAWR